MGWRNDVTIAAWQKNAGIKPGEDPSLLIEISKTAFELIKIMELERSGIRDGNGCWHGSDSVGGIISDMRELFDRLYPREAECSSADDMWFRENTGFKSAAEARRAHAYWRKSPSVRDDASNEVPW
jgi:hypothetical protein